MESGLKRLLIAERDKATRKVLKEAFKMEGYLVEVVGEGNRVIRKVREGGVSILIIDVDLSGKSGLEVIPKVKNISPKLPIIVISSDSSLELAKRVRSEGIHFYALKPIDVEELRLAVQDALRSMERRAMN